MSQHDIFYILHGEEIIDKTVYNIYLIEFQYQSYEENPSKEKWFKHIFLDFGINRYMNYRLSVQTSWVEWMMLA